MPMNERRPARPGASCKPSFPCEVSLPRVAGPRASKACARPADLGRALCGRCGERVRSARGVGERVRCFRSSGRRVCSARGRGASVSAASAAVARDSGPPAGLGRALCVRCLRSSGRRVWPARGPRVSDLCPPLPQQCPWSRCRAALQAAGRACDCVLQCPSGPLRLWRGLSSPRPPSTHCHPAPSDVFARHATPSSAHKPRSTPHLTEPPAAACCRDLHAR